MNTQLKLLLISVVTAILSGILFYQGLSPYFYSPINDKSSKPTNTAEPEASAVLGINNYEVADVVKVIDGDTIEVNINGEKKTLRYIGVNTPETVDPRKSVECFGKEASSENKRLVEGKKVYLQKDVSEIDKYGRILRYIYLPLEDNSLLFINDYLIRQGYAFSSTFPPDVKFSDQFNLAQAEAKENNRGLWAVCRAEN